MMSTSEVMHKYLDNNSPAGRLMFPELMFETLISHVIYNFPNNNR